MAISGIAWLLKAILKPFNHVVKSSKVDWTKINSLKSLETQMVLSHFHTCKGFSAFWETLLYDVKHLSRHNHLPPEGYE